MVRCHQPLSLPVDGCFVEHSPLRWIARDSSKPSRGGTETWLLHAAHSWSEAHLEDDAATVTAALLHAFAQLGGPDPASVQATAHRWRYADTANPLNAAHGGTLQQVWECAETGCTAAAWKVPG
jgi:predicted NAD/FAD-dependent oxidoreductase